VRLSGAALFSLGLAAVAAYAVYAALRWPPKAALFPLVMGIPLLVLALAQFVVDLRQRAPAAPAPGSARALPVFGWMAAFIILVLLAGFPVAVPVLVLSYLVIAGEGWILSVALAAAAWGAFHLLFQRLLHFPFEGGLIGGWFQ
jgi:hypothetical protein